MKNVFSEKDSCDSQELDEGSSTRAKELRQRMFFMSIFLLVLVTVFVVLVLLNILAFKRRTDSFGEKRASHENEYIYPFHSKNGGRKHSGFVAVSQQKSDPEVRYDGSDLFMIYQRKSEYENIYNLQFDLRCCKMDGDHKCHSLLLKANFEYACEIDSQECIDEGTEAFLAYIRMFSFEIFETEEEICSKDNEFFKTDLLRVSKVVEFNYECKGTCFPLTWEEFSRNPQFDSLWKHVDEEITRVWGYVEKKPPTKRQVDHMVYDLYETDKFDCEKGEIYEEYHTLKFDLEEAYDDFVETVHNPYCRFFTGITYLFAYSNVLDWENYRDIICHPDLVGTDCYVKHPNIGYLRSYNEMDIYDTYNRTNM